MPTLIRSYQIDLPGISGYIQSVATSSGVGNSYYPSNANPSGYIAPSQTGQFQPAGSYVTAAQSGQFYSRTNPSGFVTSGQTGNLTGQFYPLNSNPSNYILPSQTGDFLIQAVTDALYYSISNPSGFLNQSITDILYYSITNPSGYLIATGTGALTGNFYPLMSNPSGYLNTGQIIAGSGIKLSFAGNNLIINSSGYTGIPYSNSNPSGYISTGAADSRYYPLTSNPNGYTSITGIGTSGQILTSNGVGFSFQNTQAAKWINIATSGLTVSGNQNYWLNSYNGGAMTTSLPISPNDGDVVLFADLIGKNAFTSAGWSVNHQKIIATGSATITNATGNSLTSVTLNQNFGLSQFVYWAAANKWLETDTVVLPPHNLNTPTITGGAGAGTSYIISIAGSDVAGIVTLNAGSSPAGSNVIFTVTFGTSYPVVPNAIILTPANAASAMLYGTGNVYVNAGSISQTSFQVNSNSGPLTASAGYEWYYQVSQA